MDPDANLAELLQLARDFDNASDEHEGARMAELALVLADWLTTGGFLPDRWSQRHLRDTVEIDPGILTQEQLDAAGYSARAPYKETEADRRRIEEAETLAWYDVDEARVTESRWEIVEMHSPSQPIATVTAANERDALATYAIARGFADPRDTTSEDRGFFYPLPDGRVVAMVFTNSTLFARPAEGDEPRPVDVEPITPAARAAVERLLDVAEPRCGKWIRGSQCHHFTLPGTTRCALHSSSAPLLSSLAALFADGQRVPDLDNDDFGELMEIVIEEAERRGYTGLEEIRAPRP